MSHPQHPSDPEPRFVTLNGPRSFGPAAYIDEGDDRSRPPFVMLHGLPGRVRDFRWLAPVLSPTRRAIRVDTPGFAATPLETMPSPHELDRAQFVLDLLDALEVDRAVMVGHSMGGVLATACADLAPDRVAGIVYIASTGVRPHRAIRDSPPLIPVIAALNTPVVNKAVLPAFRKVFAKTGFRGYDDAQMLHSLECVVALSFPLHAARLRRLAVPSLVTWSADDPMVDNQIGDEIVAVTGGEPMRFPDGRHNPQKAYANELGEAVLARF